MIANQHRLPRFLPTEMAKLLCRCSTNRNGAKIPKHNIQRAQRQCFFGVIRLGCSINYILAFARSSFLCRPGHKLCRLETPGSIICCRDTYPYSWRRPISMPSRWVSFKAQNGSCRLNPCSHPICFAGAHVFYKATTIPKDWGWCATPILKQPKLWH